MQGIGGQVQAPPATLEIEVERGPMAGQRLTVGGELRLGSGEQGAANLGDPWLSPSHVLIYPSPGGWVIEDLRSIEGTRVSGRPVRGAAMLNPGDTIELGSTRLVLLPDGLTSLDDHPRRPAQRAATELSDENRRSLDTRRVVAALLDLLLVWPVLTLLVDYAGKTAVAALAGIAVELTYYFLCE